MIKEPSIDQDVPSDLLNVAVGLQIKGERETKTGAFMSPTTLFGKTGHPGWKKSGEERSWNTGLYPGS